MTSQLKSYLKSILGGQIVAFFESETYNVQCFKFNIHYSKFIK